MVFAASGSFDDLAHQRNCQLCKRASVPACRLFPPLSRYDPCSFRPPLLHCFCAGGLASEAYPYIDRQRTSKSQGKVRERQACNVWTWPKNVSGSLKGDDLGTGCEHSSSMSDRISHKRSQRRIAGKESGLSCAFLASSTKKTPDCLVGHAILGGNLTKGFVLLTHTAYHVRPFFRWDAIMRLTWTWMLLCGDDRRKTTEYLLECQESLREPAMRGHKVNEHW